MKPRIIYLIDNLQRGGAELSLLEILPRLKSYEPVVYTLYDRNNGLREDFIRRGIRLECLNLKSGYLNLFRSGLYTSRLSGEAPALIHSTLFKADLFSRGTARKLNVPLVNSLVNNSYDPRRYAAEHWSDRPKINVLQWLDRLTCSSVFRFLSNSAAIRDSHIKALAIEPARITVIPRGRVVPERAVSDISERKALQLKHFGRSGICFMNTGRLIERKGQGDLIDAFAGVVARHPDAFLVIAGEGPFRSELEGKSIQLGLANNVLLLGARADVPELLKAADYFVFPTWYEGLPGAVLEAMLAGVPIVASDIPENRECTGSDLALFHRVRDPQDLRRVMLEALQFSGWQEFTRAAFDRARNNFDIESVVRRYEEFYKQVVNDWNTPVKP